MTVSLFLAGGLLIGRVNSFSEVPLAGYVLIPASPLLLWGCVHGPLARPAGIQGVAIRTCLPLLMCGLALVLAAMAEWPALGE